MTTSPRDGWLKSGRLPVKTGKEDKTCAVILAFSRKFRPKRMSKDKEGKKSKWRNYGKTSGFRRPDNPVGGGCAADGKGLRDGQTSASSG